ncbi:MAG: 4a-hydroxytetrahydrobiopterin dehydratase [Thaumarchaeota archaeon]|nr:4a-hydroxytetrahydrobiopterin dehydratase [Nitrososphaerota archaeon]
MARLAAAEVDRRLEGLDGWKRKGKFITKTFTFKTFMDGIAFVNELAAIAEKQEHHPDIHLRWTTIRVEIQTHDEGGITPYDIDLATEIEKHVGGRHELKPRPAKR